MAADPPPKIDFFMPLYIGDYLADTSHLDAEQHGAYLLLLMAAWKRGGRIPVDQLLLSRIACVPQRRWLRVWGVIAHFFQEDGGQLVQRRVLRELEKARVVQGAAVRGGLASAESRRLKQGSAQPGFQLKLPESHEPPRTPFEFRSEHPHPHPDPSETVVVPGAATAPLGPVDNQEAQATAPGKSAPHGAGVALADPDRWQAWRWYDKFAYAWGAARGQLKYGRGSDADAKATGELGTMIGSLGDEEVRETQAVAPKMFELFFADQDAGRAGHLWSWFVRRWNDLRAKALGRGPAAAAPRATGYAVVKGSKDWHAGMDKVVKR